jgi:NAD(P)-dependent dehydrogenase (short-subunit alcohol dehydrogenase family)
MDKLTGKTAIVTGATSGMGKQIALTFAREGAAVVVSGRDQKRGTEVVETIMDLGGKAIFIQGDVSLPKTNRELVDKAVGHFGGLTNIVCSAGELGIASITDLSEDLWKKTYETNVSAVFYILKYGAEAIKKAGGGSVTVIGSVAGYKVFPNHPAYCSSKGAVLQLVRQSALDLGPEIRVNAIHPGQVDTPLLWNSAQAFPNPDEVIAETAKKLPLKRLGTPADIAKAALFLASEEGSWITGSNFVVDGGSLCIP